MVKTKAPHIFLPAWRAGRLLFFTDVQEGFAARLHYRVAAAKEAGETRVKPSGIAPITAEALALCQATAEHGPALQRFFRLMSGGNIGHLVDECAAELPPCAKGIDPLLYVSAYHNFLRKYMVDQAQVRHYSTTPVNQRVHPEATLAIYNILAAHLQPERALALIDADIPALETLTGSAAALANLWSGVATIQADTGDTRAAMATMGKAIALNETEDKWRQRAAFALKADALKEAIACFDKADALFPLAPPSALEMARLLVKTGYFSRAVPFLTSAEAAYPKPVEALRQTIANTAAIGH